MRIFHHNYMVPVIAKVIDVVETTRLVAQGLLQHHAAFVDLP
jgi:hypothetical protein